MTSSRRTATLMAGAIVATGALIYSSGPATDWTQAYYVRADATPRVVNEGDLVEFLAIVTDEDGNDATGTPITWDFADGSKPASGNLAAVTHRFADGGEPETTYRVRVRGGNAERTVPVSVRNVAPTLRSVSRSRPALKDEPVEFEASATDPGLADTLTYTWDFGDGATATGHRVRHTFTADGLYTVTVTVSDGDGGEDSDTMTVAINHAGSFTISGDVALPEAEVKIVRVVAMQAGTGPAARCTLRLDMQPASGDYGVVLRAVLPNGIGERDYTIGEVTEWDGMTRNEQKQPGLFFANVSLPRPHADRYFRGGTMQVGGPFWSRGGEVSVEFYDGTYLELSYSVTLVENIPADFGPRTLFVHGTFSRRVTGGGLGPAIAGLAGQSATFNTCVRDETATFDIESVKPAPNARNVPFLNPDIQVRFTKPINPATMVRSLRLDYRTPDTDSGVDSRLAAGTWSVVPGDPQAVRFVPSARLEDGVIHCVRVRTGALGLRGRQGEMLLDAGVPDYPPRYQDACVLTRSWFESREWALATSVELESLPVDLYQASLTGALTHLVIGKPTVARVYPHWTPQNHVHERAQVETFPARVTVLADDVPIAAPKRVDIRRPDRFSREDARLAQNSVNFFNWRPAGDRRSTQVRAVVESIDDSGTAHARHEGRTNQHTFWDRTEILSFDYYYIHLKGNCAKPTIGNCDWTGDIDPVWRTRARTLAFDGAIYTTQNFPVIETQPRPMGDLWIEEPPSGPCTRAAWRQYRCYRPATDREVLVSRFVGGKLHEAARESYADVIVGFVPPNFDPGWIGAMQTLTMSGDRSRRIVLLDTLRASAGTVAHEFGHFFELPHCPPAEGQACPEPIVGFRVNPSGRSGFNKHGLEGNGEIAGDPPSLDPLMYPVTRDPERRFITAPAYARLFDTIASARPQSTTSKSVSPTGLLTGLLNLVSRPVLAQSASGRVVVSGTVANNVVRIERVQHEPGTPASSRAVPAGSFTLHLLDSGGRAVHAVPFAAAPPDSTHGPADDVAAFRLDVPAPAGLQAVRVTGPSGARAEIARSPRPPAIRGDVSRENSTVRLRWTTADADGDTVRVSVFLRGDDGSWRGVITETARTEITLDATRLPSGQQVTAKLVATDGFNATSTEMAIGPGVALSAHPMSPADGATGVSLTSEITAWVFAPLQAPAGQSVPLQTGSFSLRSASGREVAADVVYDPGVGTIILTPIAPLAPATRYTATLEGVRDRQGVVLERPLTWSFATADAAPAQTGGGKAPARDAWTFSFAGGDPAVKLPDIEATVLTSLRIGSIHQLTGAHPDARLSVGIPVTKVLEAREYAPVRFMLTLPERSIVCTGGRELTVTIHETEPFRAQYEGPVACRSGDGKQKFSGKVSGVLNLAAKKR